MGIPYNLLSDPLLLEPMKGNTVNIWISAQKNNQQLSAGKNTVKDSTDDSIEDFQIKEIEMVEKWKR